MMIQAKHLPKKIHGRVGRRLFQWVIGRLRLELWEVNRYCVCGNKKCIKWKKLEGGE